MKKLFILILSCILLIGTIPFSSAADLNDKENALEITNRTELYERAKANINDAPVEIVERIKNDTQASVNGVVQIDEPLITTQCLGQTRSAEQENATYAATVFTAFEVTENNSGEMLVRAATSDYTKTEKTDDYADWIVLATTLYYETGIYNGYDYTKLNKVTTEVDFIASSVKVVTIKVRSGYRGYDMDTGDFNPLPIFKNWTTKSRALSVSQTSNCPKLEAIDGGMIHDLYGEGSVDADRGGNTFTVSHRVVEVGGFT